MRRFLASAALPFALLACTTTEPGLPPVAAAPAEPAPLSQLVDEVAIPYESFTLPNGLTVLVHTDRKSPVVGGCAGEQREGQGGGSEEAAHVYPVRRMDSDETGLARVRATGDTFDQARIELDERQAAVERERRARRRST